MSAHYRQNVKQSKITAMLISLAIVAASVAIAFYVANSQKQVLQQILAGHGDRTKVKMVDNVKDLMADLRAMSKRWVNDQSTTEDNWRADATDFIYRIEGVNSMWMIDEQFNCLWVVSESSGSEQKCQQMMDDSEHILTLINSRENQAVDFTEAQSVNDEQTVYMFEPIGDGDAFAGFIAIEINIQVFIDYVLGDPVSSGYYTKAYANEQIVYSNGPELSNNSYLNVFQLNMDSDQNYWTFKVYPTEVILSLIVTTLPYFIAIMGAIIALLFMLTLWSKQKAKFESKLLANEISEREKVQFELEYLANHDTLTHLPNRHYITNFIETRVEFSQHSQQKFTILFIDLDHFKDINDTLGHAIGDEMLKKLPILFNKIFRHDDVIARMGGDEFVVYLPGEMSVDHVAKLVERFLKSLEYPIQIEEHLIRLTGSVGVAFYPQHGANVTELLSHADAALYRAKDQGRNTFAIYDSEIEQIAKDRLQLIARLHNANENEEFEMYFQPRYSLSDSKIIGAEALIRWKTSDNKLIEPIEFIGLLEETSLIIPISWRMLKRSCDQFLKLLEFQPHLFMSFNVSAKLLEHPDFLTNIQSIFAKSQFPPDRLELELTEQTLIKNVENSQYVLNEVIKLGVSIAIDDFGTGYSSLSYLKNFPVDVLKIDKSFIQDIDSNSDDLELVKTMIAMGKNLNIITVAEGVENEAQLKILKHELCDQVQGYFFKKPMRYYDLYQLVTG
ncbi:diguanylate cyclase/phosphodiesterase (GGDEF & EAL domains) with PAS/PAC sensor(s) [hydrothermal vent metagenome]|uniref:Diguanylate cyclase/phosphodiesterase (GGDEF & EAL domains) with PAS/PAC sensor(S) n=1 Tax=hydrothermal vent metagenome TaxID=652676 RepID=A0A3B0WKB2_9ZZZZ